MIDGTRFVMKSDTPNQSELAILRSLWKREIATVREVHGDISRSKKVGYTTTLKQIQRMEEKGVIERVSKDGRAHQYRALIESNEAKKKLVKRLVDNAFDGSPGQLVLHALGGSKPTAEDISEIRSLLDKLERK